MRTNFFTIASVFSLNVCLAVSLFGQSPPQPTQEHEFLKQTVGIWNAEIKVLAPGGDKISSRGVETIEMLGEFWTIIDYKFDFMGQPARSHGTIGYDVEKKKFVGNWHESTSPHLFTMEGILDAQANSITYTMKGKNMMNQPSEYKIIMTMIDADHRNFELHKKMPGSGKMVKFVETNYTRRKK